MTADESHAAAGDSYAAGESESHPPAGTGSQPSSRGGGDATDGDHGDATDVGAWEPVEHRFESLPVHTALLHTGKVLAFGGSCNDEQSLEDPHPAELFDPERGMVETVDQGLAGDVFCAGHAFLPDGRLLAAGGTHEYDGRFSPFGLPRLPPFRGLDQAYLFDPDAERWTRVQDMSAGRWYPTLVTLGDGSVLTAAGLTEGFPWVTLRRIERYEPGTGWHVVDGAGRWLPLYPRLHLLPDGRVFYAGSYNTHYTFPFTLGSFPTATLDLETGEWTEYGLPNEAERQEGASVLLPLRPGDDFTPRVMLAGGGTPGGGESKDDAEVMAFDTDDPTWRAVESMAHARYYCYAVLLPDGTVFVMGGRSGMSGHDHDVDYDEQAGALPSSPHAIHEAELFDPETECWRSLASMTVDRLYHSNALLLPDGRVATMGSNPKRRVDELRIECYRPPYLFEGPRPTIDDVSEAVSYGEALHVRTPDAPEVEEVVLLRQSSTTHCTNTDQRLVEVPIEDVRDETVEAGVPAEPNLLPPGYYMVFVLRDGVPSGGSFVRVGHR